ncbi:MAG: multicopper oxidase domain-containing protein [Thermoplasmata archaeon]
MTFEATKTRPGPLRRALPWFVAGLLLAGIGVPGTAFAMNGFSGGPRVGEGHPIPLSGGTQQVRIVMSDTPAYSPSAITANVSSNLSVDVVNNGSLAHTFTISPVTNFEIPKNWTPAQLDDFYTMEGALANVNVSAGQQVWANFSLNSSVAPGSYEFYSLIPYQFQAGMSGTILVQGGPGIALSENTTDGLMFVPNILSVTPTTYPVTVDVLVTNLGNDGHTFTISPLSNVTILPSNFTQFFQQHSPVANSQVPPGAGGTVWANFTIDAPGVYQYICTITGHFANGMTGELYVGVAVPPTPPSPSTAIVQVGILIGGAVLLGIGVAIVVLAAFTGRLPPKPKAPEGSH